MSRIGKKPVILKSGVEIKINKDLSQYGGDNIVIKGPKGELTVELRGGISATVNNGELVLTRKDESQSSKSLHGLYRSLINNAVEGVQTGYTKQLEIQGIGYKADLVGKNLSLKLGFSHPIVVDAPEGINFEVKDGTLVTITGIDKQLVGQVAADIRSKRKPEPYKGKGVRYSGEHVRRKAGKAATKAAA